MPSPEIEGKAALKPSQPDGLELERGDNAEISTSAAERPEEIVVFRSAGSEHFAVGCDHLRRQQIVDGHPVFTDQPATHHLRESGHQYQSWARCTRDLQARRHAFLYQYHQESLRLVLNSAGCVYPRKRTHSDRSSPKPSAQSARPPTLWPPLRIAVGRCSARPKLTGQSRQQRRSTERSPQMFVTHSRSGGLVIADIRCQNLTVKYRSE